MRPDALITVLSLHVALFWAAAADVQATASLLQGLQPGAIWQHFERVLAIPRCSGNEAAMASYIREVAARRNLSVVQDGARNLIVKRPVESPKPGATPVIIQTHLDMVCEKNSDWSHDWGKDPISVTLRDGWLVADNTTLGADNGIGVCAALALMELPPNEAVPPMEFVFTVEEETGLYGAQGLDVSLLSGRHLLNFDSEEFGFIYIGCAGGGDATVNLNVTAEDVAPPMLPHRLELKGLRGGHSGADIHEYRGNALLLLARAVVELRQALPQVRLLDLQGGDKDNAIPRESSAVIALTSAAVPEAQGALASIEANLKQEYGRIDPGVSLTLSSEAVAQVEAPLSEDSALRLLDLLLALPYGPLKRSHETAGFMVETSNNVAKVKRVSPNSYEVLCFPRSSIASALEDVQNRIARAARLVGGTVTRTFTFPGWAPNSSQELLALTVDEFSNAMGSRPEILTIHAGLECGVIGDKIPGLEMVSFGPDIVGAHAPGERVKVDSVEKMWLATKSLLARLSAADGGACKNAAEEL